ncbi:unnamed protein product [Staurois parvus]|uniref:Uncharacterized protein n=1 Tax=Staurois parvus TaxID=386267 RepID=A0ABN9E2Q1_9NEOB|nr:unnamed protein product [Staurois parvus]
MSLECTNHPKNITATRRVNGSNSLNVQCCGPECSVSLSNDSVSLSNDSVSLSNDSVSLSNDSVALKSLWP